MRVAVMSDSHDNIPNLRAAITFCNNYAVALLIHCGDLISPFMLEELAAFGGAVHLIYGNNQGDQHLISSWCGVKFPAITHHGLFGSVAAGNRQFAFHHYPEIARGLASRGLFDVVCCGHNHRYQVETINGSLLVNPGELLGKDGQPGFCIIECSTLAVERVEVGSPLFGGDQV